MPPLQCGFAGGLVSGNPQGWGHWSTRFIRRVEQLTSGMKTDVPRAIDYQAVSLVARDTLLNRLGGPA